MGRCHPYLYPSCLSLCRLFLYHLCPPFDGSSFSERVTNFNSGSRSLVMVCCRPDSVAAGGSDCVDPELPAASAAATQSVLVGSYRPHWPDRFATDCQHGKVPTRRAMPGLPNKRYTSNRLACQTRHQLSESAAQSDPRNRGYRASQATAKDCCCR